MDESEPSESPTESPTELRSQSSGSIGSRLLRLSRTTTPVVSSFNLKFLVLVIWNLTNKPTWCTQGSSVPTLNEATCILKAAHAKKAIRLAQKTLIECRIEESTIRIQLYRIKAITAAKMLNDAHLDVGRARIGVGRARRQAKGLPPKLVRNRQPLSTSCCKRLPRVRAIATYCSIIRCSLCFCTWQHGVRCVGLACKLDRVFF